MSNFSWYDKLMLLVVLVCFTLVAKMIFDVKKGNQELQSKELEIQALKAENETMKQAINHPATTQEPSVRYITKTKFVPTEIPSDKEQEYVNQIRELLTKETDYKKTIDALYAMFYTGETSREIVIEGGKTSKPEVPFMNRPETPLLAPDYKISLLTEYNTDNAYGIGLGYNYKRLTVGIKGNNNNTAGIFGLWKFWR